MSESVPLLEVRDLRVVAGVNVLLDVPALKLRARESVALIGPNGAGKSTLLLALAALSRPTSGEVLFRGSSIHDGRAANLAYRRRIGLVFQEAMLLDTTIFSNVAAGLRIRGVSGPETERRVLANLERFRIGHLRDRRARTLSGGEAQRASLARALAVEPEILLMDEPYAALDPPTREALMDDLERTLREMGTTVVFVTHDRIEALRMADRMVVMGGGRIHQDGPPEEVMMRPADEFVASFVGVESILPGDVSRSAGGLLAVEVGGHVIEVAGEAVIGEKVVLFIRPENVILTTAPSGKGTSVRNVFPARVVRVVPLGAYRKVVLDCGFPLAAWVTNASALEMGLEEGRPVRAAVKATAIHFVRRGPGGVVGAK
jgi:tungstate transport system ATP-binding protein